MKNRVLLKNSKLTVNYQSNQGFWWKPHKEIIHMRTILAYGSGLRSHMGSTFYKNVGKCWSESAQKHEIWPESGPYGSVWGDTKAEWILQGLGSLWDASRTLKPPGKIKNRQIRELGEIPPISPYYPGLGLWHSLTAPAAGWPKAYYTSLKLFRCLHSQCEYFT